MTTLRYPAGDTDTVTITPDYNGHPLYYLVPSNEYYILMDEGAFRDMALNDNAAITDSTAWNFTTMAASLSYDGAFVERVANDGGIDAQITVTLTGDVFGVINPTLYTVENVPNGLNFSITRDSATQCTLKLSGNANPHDAAASINSLTITFNNGAFRGQRADLVANSSKDDISVTFTD